MAIRFLQANVNHCAGAQDLLFQSMAQWSIQVAVVAEPYFVPSGDDWASDHENRVAVISRAAAGSPPLQGVVKGRGFVASLVGQIFVIGVYFSPNRNLSEFESFLVDVGALIGQCRPRPVLIAGDLNAKSTAWGSPVTNARGGVLEDWLVSSGLSIINQGSVFTCVRHNGGSIVDVTFASDSLASRVTGWEVQEGVETLSDHRYIRFDVSALPTSPGPHRGRGGDGPRWALKHLNKEVLTEAALVQSWLPTSGEPVDVEEEAQWFREAMTGVCDAAMPRARPTTTRRQVYWWNAEIAQLRATCVAARRQYTRSRRRGRRDAATQTLLHSAYREAKTALQTAIREAKERSREELLETLDRDPWGRPYHMVRAKLRPWAPPLTQSLQPELVDRVVSTLFPAEERFVPPPMAPLSVAHHESGADSSALEVTQAELDSAVLRLRAKNTAPGPDGIPGRAWVLVMGALGERLRKLFAACLGQGRFPLAWKAGRLVLLRKEGRPLDSPSAYRPIVLLDEVGKLFERIVSDRLVEHMERTGRNVAECQFGFRRGRSTVGAILRVQTLAQQAVSQGEVVLAVSLDIANAFNTLPWDCIKEALGYHRTPPYLLRLIESYLSQRAVGFPLREGWGRREMSCGVPQGSVLGPLLWNIGYDWAIRSANPRGVAVTCYADDTLVTARAANYRGAARLATIGVAQVVGRIRRLGLKVALDKSEAVCFHGPRKAPPPGAQITVGGVHIGIEKNIKYLGLILDSRWNFQEHFRRLEPKLMGAAAALGRLLPNVGGPSVACRRLYTGVVRSMALYGAPVWADTLGRQNVAHLRRPQRAMATRVIRGYRTISTEAACVMAGTIPWDLDARALASIYFWREEAHDQVPAAREVARRREEFRDAALEVWEDRLDRPSAGLRTIEAIRPVLRQWLDRPHGVMTFWATQVLSGHGCFGRYLCRIAREPTEACHHCDSSPRDDAQHTLEACPAWAEERSSLCAAIGNDLSLPGVVRAMVGSDQAWRAVQTFCRTVMRQKEAAERLREEVSAQPQRRRRVGRRRRAYAGLDLRPN